MKNKKVITAQRSCLALFLKIWESDQIFQEWKMILSLFLLFKPKLILGEANQNFLVFSFPERNFLDAGSACPIIVYIENISEINFNFRSNLQQSD